MINNEYKSSQEIRHVLVSATIKGGVHFPVCDILPFLDIPFEAQLANLIPKATNKN